MVQKFVSIHSDSAAELPPAAGNVQYCVWVGEYSHIVCACDSMSAGCVCVCMVLFLKAIDGAATHNSVVALPFGG